MVTGWLLQYADVGKVVVDIHFDGAAALVDSSGHRSSPLHLEGQ